MLDNWSSHIRRRRPIKRRPPGWQPDPEMVAIADVEAEFPDYNLDQMTAEVNRRGIPVTPDFVDAVMAAAKPCTERGHLMINSNHRTHAKVQRIGTQS
ncbi:hypothetical protein [Nonomuraea endophytica]|uniref:hypothetical protein n=1 Tax=Nonomuraea endophytica TaxID=714136 RepID=UPI0037C7299D